MFILNKGISSIPVNSDYEDPGCSAVSGTTILPCTVKDNTIDTTTPGVYAITYEVIIGGTSHTYMRYVYVYDESLEITLYYYKKEWELII